MLDLIRTGHVFCNFLAYSKTQQKRTFKIKKSNLKIVRMLANDLWMLYSYLSSVILHSPVSHSRTQTQRDDSLVLHLFLPSRLVLLPCFHTQKHCFGYQEVHLSRVQTLLFPIDLASRLCKNCFYQNFGFSIIELVPNPSTCRLQRFLFVFQVPTNLQLAS